MDEFGSPENIRELESEIILSVLDYCKDHEYYPLNCVLAIDPFSLIVSVDIMDNVEDCDIYPVGFYMDGDMPDYDAIHELALKYFP